LQCVVVCCNLLQKLRKPKYRGHPMHVFLCIICVLLSCGGDGSAVWSDEKLQTFANSIFCEVSCVPCIPLSDPRVAVGGATAIWGGNILQTLQCVAVCCSVLQCVMTWDLKKEEPLGVATCCRQLQTRCWGGDGCMEYGVAAIVTGNFGGHF